MTIFDNLNIFKNNKIYLNIKVNKSARISNF